MTTDHPDDRTAAPGTLLLAGDVGGTNTRLALYRGDPAGEQHPQEVESRTFASGDFQRADAPVRAFLEETGATPAAACLGLPCPIEDGGCDFPNLAWEALDRGAMEAAVGGVPLTLVNDFAAVGMGLPWLRADEVQVLQEGRERPGPRGTVAVLGAGTGLGHGFVTGWDGAPAVHPSEGGHVDFAPRTELEWRLLLYLRERHGRVSWERVVSGPGLADGYRFLLAERGAPAHPKVLEAEDGGDVAATVTELATGGEDAVAAAAVELFVSCYGAQAGNVALVFRATGGLYLAGGIAPKILPALSSETFRSAFLGKGRMRSFLESVPVRLILKDDVALLGAAAAAARSLSERGVAPGTWPE